MLAVSLSGFTFIANGQEALLLKLIRYSSIQLLVPPIHLDEPTEMASLRFLSLQLLPSSNSWRQVVDMNTRNF